MRILKKLSAQHKRWCRELLLDPDNYIDCYYRAGGNAKTRRGAAPIVCNWKAQPLIQAFLEDLREEAMCTEEDMDDDAIADAQEIMSVLSQGLRSKLIKTSTHTTPEGNSHVTESTVDEVRCADLLNKMQGNYVAKKVHMTHEDLDAEIERELEVLATGSQAGAARTPPVDEWDD